MVEKKVGGRGLSVDQIRKLIDSRYRRIDVLSQCDLLGLARSSPPHAHL